MPLVETTISKEDYLKAIAEAEGEGEPMIAATLGRWLRVTPAAVTMALRRLRKDGLAEVTHEGHVHLTPAGRRIAERIRFRHHLIERMLSELFGMEWYKVHEEAERLEHAVSEDFEAKLIEKLGSDGVCPHGNDIRGESAEARRARGLRTLAELEPSTEALVESVFERDRTLLEYFDRRGLRPGSSVRVSAHNPDETIALEIGGSAVLLGCAAAAKIWMKPISRAPVARAL
jgi:DtxR family transcriptional regulator, Mn-dependent transcriptional regulator